MTNNSASTPPSAEASFLKYGMRRGKPRRRHFRLSANGELTWAETLDFAATGSGATSGRASRRIVQCSSSLLEVREGKETAVFGKTKAGRAAPSERCFSLVCESRTLDLEASSVAEKERWLALLAVHVAAARASRAKNSSMKLNQQQVKQHQRRRQQSAKMDAGTAEKLGGLHALHSWAAAMGPLWWRWAVGGATAAAAISRAVLVDAAPSVAAPVAMVVFVVVVVVVVVVVLLLLRRRLLPPGAPKAYFADAAASSFPSSSSSSSSSSSPVVSAAKGSGCDVAGLPMAQVVAPSSGHGGFCLDDDSISDGGDGRRRRSVRGVSGGGNGEGDDAAAGHVGRDGESRHDHDRRHHDRHHHDRHHPGGGGQRAVDRQTAMVVAMEVEEIFENQRYVPFFGFSDKHLFASERKRWSSGDGHYSSDIFCEVAPRPPLGWEWLHAGCITGSRIMGAGGPGLDGFAGTATTTTTMMTTTMPMMQQQQQQQQQQLTGLLTTSSSNSSSSSSSSNHHHYHHHHGAGGWQVVRGDRGGGGGGGGGASTDKQGWMYGASFGRIHRNYRRRQQQQQQQQQQQERRGARRRGLVRTRRWVRRRVLVDPAAAAAN